MDAETTMLWRSARDPRRADELSRHDLLTRYRHLRRIGKDQHTQILKLISGDAITAQARRLGLMNGKTFYLGSIEDMNLVFDLLIYSIPPLQRSRAIDRYARTAKPVPGSDEALLIAAKQQARFAIVKCLGRHPVAGLLMEDATRGEECWLVDEAMELSLPEGAAIATRLIPVEGFHMTAGVMVPLDAGLLAEVIEDSPRLFRKTPEKVLGSHRFAEAIYRVALANDVMGNVAYADVPAATSVQ